MVSVKSKSIPKLGKADVARFWVAVNRDSNDHGCWLWTGTKNTKGYGRFYFAGSIYSSCRISWKLAGREVPLDLQICHTCDNRMCVNPDHLLMADNATVARDGKLDRNLAGRRATIKKPRKDFPLFPHRNGYWCKKVRGKFAYFTRTLNDPKGEAALQLWLDRRDDLLAGRTPRTTPGDGLTVVTLCNHFLAAKEQQRDAGDIRSTTFNDYFGTCKFVVGSFGTTRLIDDLATEDFQALRAKLAKRYGPHALSREVQQIRTLFKYGVDAGLLDRPVRYGPTFKRPEKRIMRAHRQKTGQRMFEAAEIRLLLNSADQPLKAMILLGVNCGFGNCDCGTLTKNALELNNSWVNFPRPKTAIERRCPLWPETVEAIQDAMASRPTAKSREYSDLVFITKYGGPWAKDTPDNPVSKEFRKLLNVIDSAAAKDAKKRRATPPEKLHRPGRGFYCLRHSFQTIGDEVRDPVATRFLMGHSDPSMGGIYRERISDERLLDVVNHIHKWLFDTKEAKYQI